jgi:hypothetical protein
MARYSDFIGRRIEVTYRSADSGKSIFLEESYQQKGTVKTFRWEIPYPCIIQLNECPEIPRPSAAVNEPREPASESTREPSTLRLRNGIA